MTQTSKCTQHWCTTVTVCLTLTKTHRPHQQNTSATPFQTHKHTKKRLFQLVAWAHHLIPPVSTPTNTLVKSSSIRKLTDKCLHHRCSTRPSTHRQNTRLTLSGVRYIPGMHPGWLGAGVLGVVLGTRVDGSHPHGSSLGHPSFPVAQDVAVWQCCHRSNRCE